jgi:hypothetical protein
MADAKPSEVSSPLDTAEGILPAWQLFRDGGAPPCPRDARGLALSVDGAGGLYRLVCPLCGHCSPWFESSANGLVVHGRSSPDLGPEP